MLHQYASTFQKLNRTYRSGKVQFSFQSQKMGMPKDVQTTAHLDSSHTLAEQFSKLIRPGFNSTLSKNFQMLKLDLENEEESEIKLPPPV